MKNPLADVLRQSSGNDHALSDSGSFDTKAPDLGVTANDESIEAVNTEELELLESTGAIVLDDGTITFHVQDTQETELDAEFSPQATQPQVKEFDPERAPFAARFAPAICLAAAIIAAAGWTAWTTVSKSCSGISGRPAKICARSSAIVLSTFT